MGVRFLVNFVLLALPIGITLGVLLGLQQHKDATGGGPIFGGDDDQPGKTPSNNKFTHVQNCDKSFGIHPDSKGQNYTRKYHFFKSHRTWHAGFVYQASSIKPRRFVVRPPKPDRTLVTPQCRCTASAVVVLHAGDGVAGSSG
ncbi:xyloglucan-specific endoglucanase [Ilyonectria robusta]